MTENTKLENPDVAYVYAGFDHSFTLFKMYTQPLVNKETGEAGVFDNQYQGILTDLEKSSDPVGWLKQAVKAMLKKSCTDTGTQPHMWIVEFSPVLEKFTVPSHLFLDRAGDIEWLRQ